LTIFTPERRYSSKHAESRKGVRISKIEGIPQFTLPNPNYVQKMTKAKKHYCHPFNALGALNPNMASDIRSEA